MIFYHGTTNVAAEKILEKINADINKNTELDFGKGFYGSLEKDLKYAQRHALKTTKDNIGRKNIRTNAVVIKCYISDEYIKEPFVFSERNKDFIDFVFKTRLNYLNEDISYDFIRGPMADGTVDSLMSFYLRHQNILTMKFVKWCYMLPFNLHEQVVFKTQELCDKIVVQEIKNMKGELIYEQK